MNFADLKYRLSKFDTTTKLVLVNVLVFVIIFICDRIVSIKPVIESLELSPNLDLLVYKPWSLFTYIFLHWDFRHILGNMLWLYFIAKILEDLIGGKHILKLFIWGGFAGGLIFIIFYQIVYHGQLNPTFMRGASAGVSAIVIGTATFVPRYKVYLFGILPIELIWIAVIRVVFDIMGAGGSFNQGGFIAHLGGGLFGFLYIATIKGMINWPFKSLGNFSLLKKKETPKPRRKFTVQINNDDVISPKVTTKPSQSEIDEILDKINQSGYESLTKFEKEKLFKAGE